MSCRRGGDRERDVVSAGQRRRHGRARLPRARQPSHRHRPPHHLVAPWLRLVPRRRRHARRRPVATDAGRGTQARRRRVPLPRVQRRRQRVVGSRATRRQV